MIFQTISQQSNSSKIQNLQERIKHLSAPSPPQFMPPLSHPQMHPLQIRLMQIQQKLNQRSKQDQKAINALQNKVSAVGEQVRTVKRQIEKKAEKIEERFAVFERNLIEQAQQTIEQTKIVKREMLDALDKKYKTLKQEALSSITNTFTNECESSKEQLNSSLSNLHNQISEESVARDETVQFIINSFGEEILKLEEGVKRERAERADKMKSLADSLRHLEDQMRVRIDRERKDAIEGVSKLQGLLEEVCYRIEANLMK